MAHVLHEASVVMGTDKTILSVRDSAGGIERRAELVLQDAQFGLNYSIAKRGEEQSDLSHKLAQQGRRLNLITALFLPVTAITSIFGMNLVSGLEHLDEPLPFFICVVAAFAVGLYVRSRLEKG
jgi:Mg2+ and Co2+ transporter CorA